MCVEITCKNTMYMTLNKLYRDECDFLLCFCALDIFIENSVQKMSLMETGLLSEPFVLITIDT
jgi:hypothetical protein